MSIVGLFHFLKYIYIYIFLLSGAGSKAQGEERVFFLGEGMKNELMIL